jgi:RNA-directed DNA polymerase
MDSPHLYRANAEVLGVPAQIVEAAVNQSAIVEVNGFAAVLSLGHLAHRTGAQYKYLREIVERRQDPYHTFEIRRKNGRVPRLISSPDPVLMSVQRWILREILSKASTHNSSCAYQAGQNIRKCAERHLGAKWLIKLDLHDFFHTIDECRVYEVFAGLGYAPLPAFEMARIRTRQATFHGFPDPKKFQIKNQSYTRIPAYRTDRLGFLPQGSPSSGALANLVARHMDQKISAIALKERLVYTRYADDIVLSGSEAFSRSNALRLIRLVGECVSSCGFVLHVWKTRIVPPGGRRIVLGLLVDGDKVRLTRSVRSRIEGHVYGVEKFGLVSHKAAKSFSSVLGMAKYIDGLLAFAHDVDPEWAGPLRARWRSSIQRDAAALMPNSIADVFMSRYSNS